MLSPRWEGGSRSESEEVAHYHKELIPMRFGVISDLHNNLPALNAVLARMDDCDGILCCGDIIGIGPFPEEIVQRIAALPNLTAVRGNHDRYLLEGMPDAIPNDEHMGEGEMGMHRWEHARLSDASKAFLQTLPHRAEIELGGLRIAIMHYCMDERLRYINYTPDPTPEDLARMFARETADVILYGHDHAPCICRTDDRLYINPGSLGCPARDKNIARAGILFIENGQAEFSPLRIQYDAAATVAAIDAFAYPDHQPVKQFFYGVGSI